MFGTDRSVYYRYIVSSTDIMIPNEDTINIPNGQIVDLRIEKDFDNNVYPIFHIGLRMTPDIIYRILDNKSSVRFRVRMDKYAYNKNDEKYRYKEFVFSDVFGIYIDDNNAQLDKDLYRQTKNVQETATDITDMYTTYDFFLFKDSDLDAGRTLINGVLTDCTVSDAITYMLSTAGVSNVLMSLPDNRSVYDQMLIYPLGLINSIKQLNTLYGIYKHGLLTFFDLNRVYIIDKRGASTAYARDEYTDVHIFCYKSDNENTLSGGCYKDTTSKSYSINISRTNIDMKTTSIISDQLSATNVISVNPTTGNTRNVQPSVSHRGHATEQVLVNEYTNEYATEEILSRKEEMDSIIETVFFGVDFDILTPNKRFIFAFEDSIVQRRVGGSYRIKKMILSFSKEGTELNVSARVTFVRIP